MTDFGWTPTYIAAEKGHTDCLKLLVAAGANVNQLDKFQLSPLYWAAYRNHREAVSALLDAGADPHLGESPLDSRLVEDERKMFISERASRSE